MSLESLYSKYIQIIRVVCVASLLGCNKPVSSDSDKINQFYENHRLDLIKSHIFVIPLTGCKSCISTALELSNRMHCDSVDIILVKRHASILPNTLTASCVLYDSLDYMFVHYLLDDLPVLYYQENGSFKKYTIASNEIASIEDTFNHIFIP